MSWLAAAFLLVSPHVAVGTEDPNSYIDLNSNTIPYTEKLTPYDIMNHDIPGNPLTPDDYYNAQYLETTTLADDQTDPILLADLFEGDIYIPDKQLMDQLMSPQKDFFRKGTSRNAIIDESLKWPNGIVPYVISKTYKEEERLVIAKAFKTIETSSCIKFVPRKREADYIHILKADACSSSVGRIGGGAQAVSLGVGCNYAGIVMHELFHALGFWHEQSRNDRDNHITIVWPNIQAGMEYNFQKYKWTKIQSLGEPYDLSSVMHYGAKAFAKDSNKPTIIPNKNFDIGQRSYLSRIDISKLNKLYNCHNTSIVPSIVQTTVAPTVPVVDSCENNHKHCKSWADQGECIKNPVWMKLNCKKSCKECGKECGDLEPNCQFWADNGECTNNAMYMQIFCRKACKICSTIETIHCEDNNRYCESWAIGGQCRANPHWMMKNCKKACRQC